MKRLVFIICILTTVIRMSYSQVQTDSIRVLFIGNSTTCYHRLPWLVEGLAKSNGIPLSVSVVEDGEGTFQKHVTNKETINAIKKGGWNYIVLQEQTNISARDKEWVMSNVYPYANKLDSLSKVYNPKGRTVFYMTWGDYVENYPQVQQRLAENYLYMADQLDACCAPVGLAWKEYFSENHSGELHDTDRCHPNLKGAYLAANVFFTTFFKKQYLSDYTAGLASNEAQYLQRLAQKVVLTNPKEWNLP